MSVIEKSIFQAFDLCKMLFLIKNGHFINVFIVKISKNDNLKYKKAYFAKNGFSSKIFIHIFI